jgi:hypothetical protein
MKSGRRSLTFQNDSKVLQLIDSDIRREARMAAETAKSCYKFGAPLQKRFVNAVAKSRYLLARKKDGGKIPAIYIPEKFHRCLYDGSWSSTPAHIIIDWDYLIYYKKVSILMWFD